MELLQVFEDEGRELVKLTRKAEAARPVPECPDWTAADLVRHLTGVYRMVGLTVAEGRSERPSRAELAGDDTDPVSGLAEAHARVVRLLDEAPAELSCWTLWPAPNAREYWIRRMAYETLVHRVDLQNAISGTTRGSAGVEPEIAADGVDEMVTGFAQRYRGRLRAPVPSTISLSDTDTGRRWWIRLGPAEPEFGRGEIAAGTEVTARGGELLLLLWNRRTWDGLAVAGDEAPLRLWRSDAHL
ncbi:maleylpyruvate isomerase family mycothiol-dependent enzyme [Amycolatopsis alkalitolerans]|nr:maleylpyruvate isomerase family mycothiol-dependent enzyme [Amycolatopsis alkalitolerans]